jgi:4-hydroxy-tetrahydrodipicolinate synthase
LAGDILKTFEGTYVVTVTPMTSNEEVDLDALRSNVEYFIQSGVHGIVVGGSTGEFAALSVEEHKNIIDAVVDQVNSRIPVIAGTGACSTRLVVELTKFAKNTGADGVMIVPPFYTKPDEHEIYEHFRTVAETVDIPIMLYNNPWTSKVDMQPYLIAKLAEIDNIAYVKESSGDVTRVWKIINLAGDRITVFCGTDNLALESFLMGAKGWICAAANIVPKHTSRLYELVCKEKNLEKARALYAELLPLFNLLEDTGKFPHLSKAGLEMLGKKAGSPRRPLLPVDGEEKLKLKSILERIERSKLV